MYPQFVRRVTAEEAAEAEAEREVRGGEGGGGATTGGALGLG